VFLGDDGRPMKGLPVDFEAAVGYSGVIFVATPEGRYRDRSFLCERSARGGGGGGGVKCRGDVMSSESNSI
jgi:hypothetical protein